MSVDFDIIRLTHTDLPAILSYSQRFVQLGLEFREGMMLAAPTEYRPAGRIVGLHDDGHSPYASIVLRGRTTVNVTLRGHLPYLVDHMTMLAVEDWVSRLCLRNGKRVMLSRSPDGSAEFHSGGAVHSRKIYLQSLIDAAEAALGRSATTEEA